MSGVPELADYKYGFHEDVTPVYETGMGLSEEVVRTISKMKNEPQWMLDFRLKSLKAFEGMPMPTWGADLSEIDFDAITYFKRASDKLVLGMMFLRKLKIHLKKSGFRKQNVRI